MTSPIRVPRVGQNMTEATLVSWERSTGDVVAPGDVVATIETDKTEIEVEAPVAGVLGLLRANEGDVCAVGMLLAHVLVDGEAEPGEATASAVAAAPVAPPPPEPGAPSGARVRVSPRAKRVAEELGVDLAHVAGTGSDGLINEADVRAAAGAPRPAPGLQTGTERRRALTARERTAVRNLATSWARAPHFTQMVDADVTDVVAGNTGPRGVTFNDHVVHALARALRAVPACNVRYEDDDRGPCVVELDVVDIAIAVDAPGGLALPVVRGVDALDRAALARRTRDVIARARAAALTPDDVRGGSATVSNLGASGIRAGTAVLPVDHAVLVFVGAIEPRAVVRDDTIVVRTMCTLSLTFDHRVVDGATAAQLTTTLVSILEQGEPR